MTRIFPNYTHWLEGRINPEYIVISGLWEFFGYSYDNEDSNWAV